MKMPIGKFKGQPVASMTTTYLAWLVTNDHIRFKRWPLIKEALQVLRKRFESFDALVAELQMDASPPEYWKATASHQDKAKIRAEKLAALEARRSAEQLARLEALKTKFKERQVNPSQVTDIDRATRAAALQAELVRRKTVADPNDISDLI